MTRSTKTSRDMAKPVKICWDSQICKDSKVCEEEERGNAENCQRIRERFKPSLLKRAVLGRKIFLGEEKSVNVTQIGK